MRQYRLNDMCKQLATLGPIGYAWAPGTLGSCVGLMLMYSLYPVVQTYSFLSLLLLILVLCGVFFIIQRASLLFVCSDPQEIILDEVLGCCIALFGIVWHWRSILVCFVLFRFFDISKTVGIAYLERRYSGPVGIMLDDIYAGLLANILTRSLLYYGILH